MVFGKKEIEKSESELNRLNLKYKSLVGFVKDGLKTDYVNKEKLLRLSDKIEKTSRTLLELKKTQQGSYNK